MKIDIEKSKDGTLLVTVCADPWAEKPHPYRVQVTAEQADQFVRLVQVVRQAKTLKVSLEL